MAELREPLFQNLPRTGVPPLQSHEKLQEQANPVGRVIAAAWPASAMGMGVFFDLMSKSPKEEAAATFPLQPQRDVQRLKKTKRMAVPEIIRKLAS